MNTDSGQSIKMQTLKVTRGVIASFGMCTLSKGNKLGSKIVQIITMISALVILIQLNLFSVCYVWQHLKENDIESSTFALMQVIAIFSTIASFVSLIYHRNSVCHFFDRIQAIVDQYTSPSSAVIYSHVDKFCETFMIWVTIFMVASYVVSTLVPVIGGSLFYYIKSGAVDARDLNLPLKLKTPFNQNELLGFTGVLAIECVGGSMFLTITTIISSLFLSMGMYFGAFCAHFELMFQNMSELSMENMPAFKRMQLLKTRLTEAVNFHNHAKGVFELCRKMLSAMVFFQLVTAALYISGVNFELESVIKAADIRILIAVISMMTSAGNNFLYCYVGTFTTVKFLRFSDAAYESLWYKFPVELQKYMRLIIADAQRSRAFDGYGVMDLNLMTFAKVMKSAVSFYLMIKTFAE